MSGITLDSLDSIVVTATDLDIRGLNVATDGDHVYLTDSTGANALTVAADGSIAVTDNGTTLSVDDGGSTLSIDDGGGSITVDGTVSIGNLVNTADSVAIGDETNLIDLQQIDAAFSLTAWTFPISGVRRDADTSPVSADGDSHPLVFNDTGFLKTESNFASEADDAAAVTNPLGVGGVSADSATALAEISAAGDRAHLLQDMYRRLHIRNSNDVAWQVTPVTVGATETEIAATPLNGRKEVIIQNVSTNSVWVGEATGVTTTGATRGIEIPKKSSMSFPFGEALNLFVISDGAGREINVLEAA